MAAFRKEPSTAGLTAKGREQARVTAKKLRTLDASEIHYSTILRARETAMIIAREFSDLVARPTNLLRELPNLGPVDDEQWRATFTEGKRRGERAFTRFVQPTRRKQRIEILVTHGNLIRYFACRVLGIEPEKWSKLGTKHCGITVLSVTSSENVEMICYGDPAEFPNRHRVQVHSATQCPSDEYGSHNISTLDHAIDQDNVRIDFNQRSENILVVPGPRHLSGD